MDYPKSIAEVEEALKSHTLVEGQHVEFKIYHSRINVDELVRIMIGFANSGGGVIIIGFAELPPSAHVEHSYIGHGIPSSFKTDVAGRLADLISSRVINLKWSYGVGHLFEMDFGAIFVSPSENGMCFLFSDSDFSNRTFYKRQNDKNVISRKQYRTVYKYMTLDSAIASMESKAWRFFEPIKWSDKFESRFYCAEYDNLPTGADCVQRVYATCVTRTRNSEAAWKVYAGREGMNSHCIQLELDLSELLWQLLASDKKIFERKVEYVEEYLLMHLHESGKTLHAQYFSGFSFDSFLDLLALKRNAYTYENEIRFFAVPQKPETRNYKKAESIDIPMQWDKVIKRLRVDKKCSLSELVALRHSCWSCGIDPMIPKIKGKELPGNRIPEADKMKKVEVILFDIDDMPGKKRISIEP